MYCDAHLKWAKAGGFRDVRARYVSTKKQVVHLKKRWSR